MLVKSFAWTANFTPTANTFCITLNTHFSQYFLLQVPCWFWVNYFSVSIMQCWKKKTLKLDHPASEDFSSSYILLQLYWHRHPGCCVSHWPLCTQAAAVKGNFPLIIHIISSFSASSSELHFITPTDSPKGSSSHSAAVIYFSSNRCRFSWDC